MPNYVFQKAIADPGNWINQYIDYAKELTDAPYEYHEAHALLLLSLATEGLRATFPTHPNGLATNLYVLLFGQSSLMRKSTAMEIAAEIQDRAIPGARVSENFTPGGLEEQMAERNDRPSMLYADEFSGIIEKMHHQPFMAELRPFLLTMYRGGSWRYTRRAKGGKKDEVNITGGHLSLAGNVTPAISKRLTEGDVLDGFLARFAIVAPPIKPGRRNLLDFKQVDRNKRVDVWKGLETVYHTAREAKEKRSQIDFEALALDAIDRFHDGIEAKQTKMDDVSTVMTERLGDMALKVAMLIAAGRKDGFRWGQLMVTGYDAEQAVQLASKWMKYAISFAESISHSKLDGYMKRVVRWLEEHGGEAPRWDICRRLGFDRRLADDIQMTLIDHNRLSVREIASNGSKPTLLWILKEEQPLEPLKVEELKDGNGGDNNGSADVRPVQRDGVGGDDDGRSVRPDAAGGGEVPEVPW